MRGLTTESHAMVNEAVDLLEQAAALGDQSSMGDRVQWLLAAALTSRGASAKQTQDFRSAEDNYRRSIEVAGKLLPGSDYLTSAQLQMGTALNELGRVVGADPNRRSEARVSFDRAIQILDSLAKESTNFPYYREALAASFAGRATVHDAARMADAEKDCDTAKSILTALLQSEPDNPDYLSQLGDVLELESKLALAQGRRDKARQLLDQAISHIEHALRVDTDRAGDAVKLSRYGKLAKEISAKISK